MKFIQVIKALPAFALFGLTACSSMDVSEMTQLDNNGAREIMLGKTHTFKTKYGKWAEYVQPSELTGVGRAWGDWGSEQASATHSISEAGEVCTQYQGEYDWASSKHQFCGIYFEDAEGAIYIKTTKNTYKPERVGQVRSVAVSEGDKYNLMN